MKGRQLAAATCAAVALLWAPTAEAAPIPIERPSWAGVVASSAGAPLRFTVVHGRWIEPAVTCKVAGSSAAFWVGLGGFAPGSSALEQIGTSVRCDARGQAQHRAWFEFWPYPAYPFDARVQPGNSMSATVQVMGTTVRLRLQNLSRHWSVTKIVSSLAPDLSTAEWIVEAPQACRRYTCGRTPLASFGSVSFTDVSAATPTTSGGLSNSTWTLYVSSLVPRDEPPARIKEGAGDEGTVPDAPTSPARATGGPGAIPGQPSPDGHSFVVDWSPKT